jgi:hypothetical protein
LGCGGAHGLGSIVDWLWMREDAATLQDNRVACDGWRGKFQAEKRKYGETGIQYCGKLSYLIDFIRFN